METDFSFCWVSDFLELPLSKDDVYKAFFILTSYIYIYIISI